MIVKIFQNVFLITFSGDEILCDKNIAAHVADNNGRINYENARYYIITKNTDLYKSWHEDGHNNNVVGTPHYYN